MVYVETIQFDKVARILKKERVEIIPCTETSPELDISSEKVRQYMLSLNLFCLKDLDKIELYGELS